MKKILILLFLLGGCAGSNSSEIYDPLESINRPIHSFNRTVERNVMRPLAEGYKYITPDFVQEGFSNFFQNLATPWTFLNDLLQGKFGHASESFYRFAVNSTFGIGGLLDVAESEANVKGHKEDFGQTLAVWGVEEGPVVVVPFISPMSLRDVGGFAGDIVLDPTYEAKPFQELSFAQRFALLSLGGTIVRYADNLDAIKQLDDTALDHYATTVSVMRQLRQKEIQDQWDTSKEASESDAPKSYDVEMNFDDEEEED